MLTPEEDVEITSLKARGWTISAIARHVGHDRKTVRAYLSAEHEPGVRVKSESDVFDRFEPYVRQRLVDDPHVWATTLFDELVGLGFDRSYQTFTGQLRDRDLRPHCERPRPCTASSTPPMSGEASPSPRTCTASGFDTIHAHSPGHRARPPQARSFMS